MADLLEHIWSDAINIDADGKWIERSFKAPSGLEQHYAACGPALKRLKNFRSPKEIGLISRLVRYETIFGLLYSFDDPGFPKSKSASFDPHALIQAALSGGKQDKKLAPFLQSLRETLSLEDDGQWLVTLTKQQQQADQPFGDVGPAVKRLLEREAALADLAQLAVWSRYEACTVALQLIKNAELTVPDEICGLHESLLGADPSGKEGRPKSWPLTATAAKAPKAKSANGSNEPLWRMRSGQAIAFSPDGKILAVGSASAAARLFDARTGKEILQCEGIKAHIYEVAFSPDGKHLAVADIHERLTICDVSTGKVLAKAKFPAEEISGLAYSRKTGDLFRSAWKETIDVIEPLTGRLQEPLCPPQPTRMINAMKVSSAGDRVVAISNATEQGKKFVTVWSWPERRVLFNFEIADELTMRASLSPINGTLAMSVRICGGKKTPDHVLLCDVTTGKPVRELELKDPKDVTFAPAGTLIVAAEKTLHFFDSKGWKPIRQFATGDDAFHISASADGKLLAFAGWNGVRVWEL